MDNVLLVAYLLIVLALIIVILLQRSEGGALGIGGGNNGMMQARSSANVMTRTTAVLATLFFASAIGLTIMSELNRTTSSILDSATSTPDGQQPSTVLDALNALQGDLPIPAQTPEAPTESTTTSGDLPVPAAPAETETAPAADTMMMAPAPEAPADSGAAPEETPSAPTGN